MVQNLYKVGLINVSIPQEAKCFNTPHFYTTDGHFCNTSINIGCIFFSSPYIQQSHHLLDATLLALILRLYLF